MCVRHVIYLRMFWGSSDHDRRDVVRLPFSSHTDIRDAKGGSSGGDGDGGGNVGAGSRCGVSPDMNGLVSVYV
jgi:hypothetical protein